MIWYSTRVVLILCICGTLFFLNVRHAQAAAEFCPATVEGTPQRVLSGMYMLRLAAMSPRSITGFVRLETANGWFNAPFTNLVLHEKPKQAVSDYAIYMLNGYISDPVYVRLPVDAAVSYAYVSQASTTGETVFGWDKSGTMPCDPPPKDEFVAPDPLASPPAANVSPLIARAIDPPYSATCDGAFSDTKFERAPKMNMPDIVAGDTALQANPTRVAVALNKDGSVLDAWVWQASGVPALDSAAMNEAKAATYSPAHSYCKAVPGFYIFNVQWN